MSKLIATGEQPKVLMRAITSGAVRLKDGSEPSFREGETFDADSPIVQAAPLFFIGAWATTAEIHQAQVDRGILFGVV